MSKTKFRLVLNSCIPSECRGVNIHEILEEIKFSKNCLVIYSNLGGKVEVLFTGYNEELLLDVVVAMCYHENLYKFLKLSVIATDDIKKGKAKGRDFIELASNYIKTRLND